MKSKFAFLILLIPAQDGFAQEKNIQLSLSSGITNSSSEQKNNLIGNGYNLQADVFLPLLNNDRTGIKENSFTLGFNLAGNFTRQKNLHPDIIDASTKYNVYNNTVDIDSRTSKPMSNSFSGLAGIQAQLRFGNISFSPMISAGYLVLQQEGFVQNGSISVNGQQHQRELIKSDPQKQQGFLFKPQLRAGYNLSRSVSLFASAAFLSGPTMEHTTFSLLPAGGFKENNTYEISQLANGTWESSTQQSRYNTTEFNIGLSLAIGKKKKGQGAASASYAAGKSIQSDINASNESANSPAARSISEKAVKRNEAMAAARPGSPIGGIVVKGGKNPGGNNIDLVSDENGKISFDIQESGEYLLQLKAPEQSSAKSINEKGVKRTEAAALAKPGNPIGGIIVKGGKNPGGSFIQVISNYNGEILLTLPEAGNYLLVLYAPAQEANPPKNSRKEKKKEKGSSAPGLKDVIKTQV